MRKNLLKLMLLLMAIALGTQLSAQSVATSSEKKVVRVKLQREVADRLLKSPMTMSNGVVTTGITPLDRANRQVKAVSIKRLIPYSPKFEERHKAAGLDLWYEVTFDSEAATPRVGTLALQDRARCADCRGSKADEGSSAKARRAWCHRPNWPPRLRQTCR